MLNDPPSPLKPANAHTEEDERRSTVRRVQSRELLGSAGELVIEHAGREYRLRVTQHGKLILTA